jgi:hypothetical protein
LVVKRTFIKVFGLTAIALGAFAVNANAQCSTCASSSGSVDVYARVVIPINVCGCEEMNFGALCAPGTSSGTVTITPDHASGTSTGGTLSYSGITAITQGAIGNDPQDGNVTGEPGLTFNFTITTSGLGKMTGVAPPIALGGFTTSFGGTPPQTIGTLPVSGRQDINVGATITVPAGQPSGWYRGSITMTATYN